MISLNEFSLSSDEIEQVVLVDDAGNTLGGWFVSPVSTDHRIGYWGTLKIPAGHSVTLKVLPHEPDQVKYLDWLEEGWFVEDAADLEWEE